MEVFKAPKPAFPCCDNPVAVIAEPPRPASGGASDVFHRFVYTRCPKIECRDGSRLAQGDKEFVQGKDIVWPKDIRSFACDKDVKIVAYPMCEMLEPVA